MFFARVRGTPFPMVSNLFGTADRTRFLFRDALARVRKLVELLNSPQVEQYIKDTFKGAVIPAFGTPAA